MPCDPYWPNREQNSPEIHVQGSSAMRREAVTGLAWPSGAANDPLLPVNSETSAANATPQAGIRHAPGHPLLMLHIISTGRHRDLSRLRRHTPDHRMDRGSAADSQDPRPCAVARGPDRQYSPRAANGFNRRTAAHIALMDGALRVTFGR